MVKKRADLGFADALDEFNPQEWEPKLEESLRLKPERAATLAIAEISGFKSREAPEARRVGGESNPPRRRRTGRNAQFNLKARPETIAAFCNVADNQGWGLGETLERAVELLEKEYGRN